MEVFQPLSDFYKAIDDDARINSKHISLYFALLYKWNSDHQNPLLVFRDELMRTAKINARQTYNKCMNELAEYGYINYYPSSNAFEGSKVYLIFINENEGYGKCGGANVVPL